MSNRLNILLTGVGAPGGPGILKALSADKSFFLHGADMNPLASGSFLCKKFHCIPKASSQEFISSLVELCKSNKIDFILPLVTKELFLLSKNVDQFESFGTKIIVSDYASLQIANDKGKLYEALQHSKLSVPDFRIVSNVNDLEKAAKELGYPTIPVVMKPCQGNGSRGIRVLDKNKDRFELLFNTKPSTLYSSLDEILVIIGDKQFGPLVVSEYLPGQELTIDTIVNSGHVSEIMIRTRDTINNGISTSGRFIADKNVEGYIRSIVSSLPGLYGPIGFQLKKSQGGEFKLLESNPRLQGTSVAALGAGVNFPVLSVYEAAGLTKPKYEKLANVGFIRYYEEVFYNY